MTCCITADGAADHVDADSGAAVGVALNSYPPPLPLTSFGIFSMRCALARWAALECDIDGDMFKSVEMLGMASALTGGRIRESC
jgi:hypothetical protein